MLNQHIYGCFFLGQFLHGHDRGEGLGGSHEGRGKDHGQVLGVHPVLVLQELNSGKNIL